MTNKTSVSEPSLTNWCGSPGKKDAGVTRDDRRRSVAVPHAAAAGDHVIELPLRAVGVIRDRRLARWNAQDLDVERMALHNIRRVALAAQRLGDLNPFGPPPWFLWATTISSVRARWCSTLRIDSHSFDAKKRGGGGKLCTERGLGDAARRRSSRFFSARTSMQPLSFCNVPSTIRVEDVRIGRRKVS